jgi:endonuclease YncB( thermonuclease family)/8-oxo-dGTP pyrophosphatase MutT (NUDIX family)
MHQVADGVFYHYINFDKCKTNRDIKYEKTHLKLQLNVNNDSENKNIRWYYIQSLKKYVCFDTDDKKSNDLMKMIMKKYNINGNCYPSISNYFKPEIEDNRHKYHYWFETDLPITSHIHMNNTLLDVWGPKCYYTNVDMFFSKDSSRPLTLGKNGEDYRIIFEPNVPGNYLDTSKKYPCLTSEIYNEIMNININAGLFSKKEKAPSCLLHDNCIDFERFKNLEENGFMCDGYPQLSDHYKKILNDHQSYRVNKATPIIHDLSRGVICCVNVDGSKDPFIVALRMNKEGRVSNSWGLPKGHPSLNETEINNAVREMREETGVDVCKYVHEDAYFSEKYTFVAPMHHDRWKMHSNYPNESKRPLCIHYKEVKYFLAVLPEKVELTPQPQEVLECKWIRLSEFKKLTYPSTNTLLTPFIESKKVKSKLECKSQPFLQTLFEKTNSKYYYQLKYKDYDNSMPLYNSSDGKAIVSSKLLKRIVVWAKVVNVHDGDTIHAVFQFSGEPVRKYKIRLTTTDTKKYIDAPEINSKSHDEKMKAYASKKFVEELILNKIVRLEINGSDCYKRLTAIVYTNGDRDLSEIIHQNKHDEFKFINKNDYYYKKISGSDGLLNHIKKEESKYPRIMKKQESKLAFNILDPFHMFDKSKKIKESDIQKKDFEHDTIDKKKGLFDLFKKK